MVHGDHVGEAKANSEANHVQDGEAHEVTQEGDDQMKRQANCTCT